MPPRKTTDFGAVFESLIEDLRIELAASIDQSLGEWHKRLARLERRLNELDPAHATAEAEAHRKRPCTVCSKPSVARNLCSAHYQQWRYRVRKAKARSERSEATEEKRLLLAGPPAEMSHDN